LWRLRRATACFRSRPRYCAIGGIRLGPEAHRSGCRPCRFGSSRPRSRCAIYPRMIGTS
jgi:hypothetical protein